MSSYCDVSDIENRLLTAIADGDTPAVLAAITEASTYLDAMIARYAINKPSDDILKMLCTDLVSSWYSRSATPANAASQSQTVGDVSQSITYNSTSGAQSPWWLSRYQLGLLGVKATFGSIRMIREGEDDIL